MDELRDYTISIEIRIMEAEKMRDLEYYRGRIQKAVYDDLHKFVGQIRHNDLRVKVWIREIEKA